MFNVLSERNYYHIDGRLSSDGGGVSSWKNGRRYRLKHRHRKRDSQRAGKTRWVV